MEERNKYALPTNDNIDPVGFLPEGSEALAKYIDEDLNIESEDELNPAELSKEGHNLKYFLKAAEKGKKELVEKLLISNETLINLKDSDGYSALHRASYNGHVDVVHLLLEHGADISSQTDDNWQPLHCACRWDQANVASVLLQNGANINAQTTGGHTPSHLAATHSQESVLLEILLTNKNIDPSIKNCHHETALDLAKRNGKHMLMFELVEPSANVKW